MTIQVIINSAQSIEFDRRKVVGQTVSRSERIKVAERASGQAFSFTITPIARFRYSLVRDVIESIQTYDRSEEQQINLASNPLLSYITEYQGGLSSAELANLTINTFTNSTLIIGGLGSVSNGTVVFKGGDWIQPIWSRYPYIVSSTVTKSLSTASVTVHRPLITSEATTVTGALYVGTATTLRVVVTELPTYKLIQRDWAEFTGDFSIVEKIV